jgi:G:T-mismatch repair DNA endonuclease (very short patch repair protein)
MEDINNTITLKNFIWEEKNSIEPSKKNDTEIELNQQTTIEKTQKEFERKECCDIGKKRKKWTTQEIEKLKYLYENLGKCKTEIIFEFPSRTIDSIGLKIKRLKLKHTNEQKQKIFSRIRIGDKNPRFGKIPYTKGYTKYTLLCLKKGSIKIKKIISEKIKNGTYHGFKNAGKNNPMYGKPSWCRGLTKETSEILKKSFEKSKKTKIKNYKNLPLNEKLKIKERMAYIGSKCKKKNTSIEIKIQNFLKEININFESDYVKGGFSFDIFIPDKNLIIECQGDYWHRNPLIFKNKKLDKIQKVNIKRDKKKLKYLIKNKYKYLFLWENDIRKNFEFVKCLISKTIKN